MLRHLTALYRNLFRKEHIDQELDEEIRTYFELSAAEKMRCGMPPERALGEARREIAGIDQVKESVRDIRIGVSVDTLRQDIRFAFRTLARNRAFALVAMVTLALGIGANTTIFSVVNGVLLKPLPYPEPDRLLMLWEKQLSDGSLGTVAAANFYDWREQTRCSKKLAQNGAPRAADNAKEFPPGMAARNPAPLCAFDQMAALDPYPDFILTGLGEPRRLEGAAVTASFFPLLRVHMALGRSFLAEEDRPGKSQVIILSYSTWLDDFGGRADVIGKPVTLNNAGYTIVGVLPPGFSLVSKSEDFQSRSRFDVWTPLALASPPEPWQRGTHPLCVFARLKPGAALTQAQAELNRVAANLQRLYPDYDKERGIAAVPWKQHVLADVRTALFTLLAAVGMVYLIACANIANLLLTRAAGRQKEMALRVALGASRRRIAQQLVTESLVLTMLGALAGLALAFFSVPVLVRHLPADLPRAAEIAVDGRVLAFTCMVSLITGVVFGLVPLVQSRRVSSNDGLKHAGRGIVTGQSRLRNALIVGQIAVALVLLIGAGLMAKSFWRLLGVPPGFQTGHILTARLSLPPRYTNGMVFGTGAHPRISTFQQELLQRVRGIPGVRSAAYTAYLPLSGISNSWSFDIEGRAAKPLGVSDVTNYRPVSAGYFETIGIPLLAGRFFDARDREHHPLVVIINESMARAFWNRSNPVGQRLRFGDAQWRTVVGVVGDVHHEALGAKPEPEMYVPYGQIPNVEARPTIVLRTSIEPASVITALRKAIAEVDAGVPLDQIATMQQIVSGSVGQSRFRTEVLLMFGFLALFVPAVGLYGVMSYQVSQRTREFGVRMAVGATRNSVVWLVLRQAARLVILGIGLGLLGGAAMARLIGSLLYGVAPLDPATLAGVSILLVVVALLASYLPAHRAAKADPMDSLRYE